MDVPAGAATLMALLNTADLESGADALPDADALVAWLQEQRLLDEPAPADPSDLALAVDLREGLRSALEVHGETTRGTDRLSAALAALPVVLTGDLVAQPAPGLPPVPAALARLVSLVVEARADGSLARVKVCARDSCRWAFWDASRNRSHTWCSMRVCGNREKMRRRAERATSA